MRFKNVIKDKAFFKCDNPAHTIEKIEEGLKKLGLKVKYSESMVSHSKSLFWSNLKIPSLDYFVEGKGTSSELAKASAYAEMAERISSGLAVKTDFLGKYDYNQIFPELRNYSNFNYLDGYVNAYQNDLKNPLKIESIFSNIKEFSSGDLERIKKSDIGQHWVNGYSIIKDEQIKVPIKLLQKISGTNGIAAGNTIEEAIVQASNEIFERYTTIDTIRDKKIIPTIDLKTIKDEQVNQIINLFKKNKFNVMVKDFSNNGLFPCYGVLIKNENVANDNNPIKRAYKYRSVRVASSFNGREALLRCFTEKAQGKTFDILKKEKYLDFIWYNFLKYYDADYKPIVFYYNLLRKYEYAGDLNFLEQGEIKKYNPGNSTYDCAIEIEEIKHICKRINTDFIMVNHTHPLINFPVVRIIIPGLSDVLSYTRFYNKRRLLDKIIEPSQAEGDFEVTNEVFLYTEGWLKNNNEITKMIKNLIDYIKAYNTHFVYTFGIFHRKMDVFKILAILFYKVNDLKSVGICTDVLSTLYPYDKRYYKYLKLLTIRGKKEKLFNELKKMEGYEKLLLEDSKENIFYPQFNGEYQNDFEKNYILDLKKLINSFYVKSGNQ